MLIDPVDISWLLTESGEEHDVDGNTIMAVAVDIAFKELGPAFEGALGQAKRLYMSAADMIGSYTPGRRLTLDSITWDIADLRNRGGLLTIDLYRNRL